MTTMTQENFTRAMAARMTASTAGPVCMRPCDRCDAQAQATMRRNRFEMFVAAQRRNARWQ